MRFKEWLDQKPAILLATGAFSPIHKGHLEMFKEAKEYLESQGYKVIKGYISPKHNDYVASKTADYLDIDYRISLINKAIKDSGMGWIEIFDWESRQPNQMGKKHVVNKIQNLNPDAKIFFVCGEDNCPLPSYPGIAQMDGFNWISTGRAGFSSSRVRRALKSGDENELDLMLYPSVKGELLKKSRITEENQENNFNISDMYFRNSEKIKEISKKTGKSTGHIYRVLKKFGGPNRIKKNYQVVKSLHDSGFGYKSIANLSGYTLRHIRNILKK
jgi:nicotinic acid mononucleotide adenylyltransferase